MARTALDTEPATVEFFNYVFCKGKFFELFYCWLFVNSGLITYRFIHVCRLIEERTFKINKKKDRNAKNFSILLFLSFYTHGKITLFTGIIYLLIVRQHLA